MPLHIVRQDITKMKCDAIVNAANSSLLGGGGVDGAIHKAAGIGLYYECKELGGCDTGDAKLTLGYDLPCKYVIHTVGPVWKGGNNGERELLVSCYKKSLTLAKEKNCQTVAFPLISSGIYGYPRREALTVAADTISEFLSCNEMTVYLVVFDKLSYSISARLFYEVSQYIDDNYVGEIEEPCFLRRCESASFNASYSKALPLSEEKIAEKGRISLTDMLSKLDDNFAVTLLKLINVKGLSDVECYKKANVSKQTWYKIMNEKDYKPSKNTVISFAIALELTLDEAQQLLSTVGFTLSKSSKFDVIIEYFLKKREYNIFTINETLFKFDQTCLGI